MLMAMAAACTSVREARQETFAQKCAEAFPPRIDTLIVEHWEVVNFPVTEYDTVVLASVPCPPGLTDTLWVTNEVQVRVPGRTVHIPVVRRDTVFWQTDTALKAAYDDLIEQYETLLADCILQDARVKSLEAELNRTRSGWPRWVWIAIGAGIGFLIIWIASRALQGKKNTR